MALDLPDAYFNGLSAEYAGRRTAALAMLEKAGFDCFVPNGAYYIMTGITAFDAASDVEFARFLVETIGVAGVPGSSFYHHSVSGNTKIRFCFCKKYETLTAAGQKLASLAGRRCF